MLGLKKSYASREVAALTGLTARQLRWWDRQGIFSPSIPSRKTAAGGRTERRYSPIDLLELVVLADLRRRGFSMARLRRMLEALERQFHARLFEAIGGGARLRLLTDGHEIYVRMADGQLVNLLRDAAQRLLTIGLDEQFREISARLRVHRKKKKTP